MNLKIATYNIAAGLSNGYFKKKNYYKAADVIKSINADIITLNEVGKPLPDFIKEHTDFIANHCGYKYFIFAKATTYRAFPYGNAVLSKYPIESSEIYPIKKFVQLLPGIYEPRCILSVKISSEKPVRIICTHLGLFPDEQKMGLLKVSQLVKASEIPTVFMGDLNISNNNKMFTPIKSILKDACEMHGITLKTYPSFKPRKRLDYIFVTENISVTDVKVVNNIASDHLPLVAKIII